MIRVLSGLDAVQYWDLRLQALRVNPDAFVTTYEEAMQKENPVEEVAQNLNSKTSYTFGAFNDENRLLGVVTLLTEQKAAYKHKGHLVAMYVDAQSRGEGIAKALIGALVEKSRELKIEQINLGVVSDNEVAKKLYQSMGFTTYGTEKRALKMNNIYRDDEHMVLFL
ncbi:GNAT family N-acetyltransferase [Bacillus pseudomycoides]|uniref:GNAT family N-acetyltransferase n=1 Tax=Bacillus pseudomycoides TaxID=64104 RepID=A0AA91VAW8_9BACI|nr:MULTISPECIES: GNAT family N-acetyltransferase [Bacillus]PEB50613.1 GNAT family N-acetyltransferase [Bacillus sp. AFS098217]PED81886.1 GNAT family N-acetyltransferase [Bacillus pseudomycoides]PEU07996.1 GNAT family N-acetyltransferase [Bacillus sp. AFS019443]PEU14262.1 GNAT family N-acetyltransferase [Bacillus sp. AFS014408]PFW59111.1 GNAT family N-acetyltransferase [Bacillus sp. AFS075034]